MSQYNGIAGIRQYFQPIVDLNNFEVKHHEVLIRSIDENNPINVQSFVDDFEDRGDIHLLDQWSLRSILTSHQSGILNPESSFAVNVSAHSIENPAFQRWFNSFCKQAAGQVGLIIEITETSPITDFNLIDTFCDISKASGFEIAIDDYGSGYANDDYLHNIRADYLKLDGSLIRDMKSTETWKQLQETMSVCRRKGIKVIAEQIEVPSQMKQAKLLGCGYGQGYLFGKPAKEQCDRKQVTQNYVDARANEPKEHEAGEIHTLSR